MVHISMSIVYVHVCAIDVCVCTFICNTCTYVLYLEKGSTKGNVMEYKIQESYLPFQQGLPHPECLCLSYYIRFPFDLLSVVKG